MNKAPRARRKPRTLPLNLRIGQAVVVLTPDRHGLPIYQTGAVVELRPVVKVQLWIYSDAHGIPDEKLNPLRPRETVSIVDGRRISNADVSDTKWAKVKRFWSESYARADEIRRQWEEYGPLPADEMLNKLGEDGTNIASAFVTAPANKTRDEVGLSGSESKRDFHRQSSVDRRRLIGSIRGTSRASLSVTQSRASLSIGGMDPMDAKAAHLTSSLSRSAPSTANTDPIDICKGNRLLRPSSNVASVFHKSAESVEADIALKRRYNTQVFQKNRVVWHGEEVCGPGAKPLHCTVMSILTPLDMEIRHNRFGTLLLHLYGVELPDVDPNGEPWRRAMEKVVETLGVGRSIVVSVQRIESGEERPCLHAYVDTADTSVWVQAALVKSGLVYVQHPSAATGDGGANDNARSDRLRAFERNAKSRGAGVWSTGVRSPFEQMKSFVQRSGVDFQRQSSLTANRHSVFSSSYRGSFSPMTLQIPSPTSTAEGLSPKSPLTPGSRRSPGNPFGSRTSPVELKRTASGASLVLSDLMLASHRRTHSGGSSPVGEVAGTGSQPSKRVNIVIVDDDDS